jgi:hypothetical protein
VIPHASRSSRIGLLRASQMYCLMAKSFVPRPRLAGDAAPHPLQPAPPATTVAVRNQVR